MMIEPVQLFWLTIALFSALFFLLLVALYWFIWGRHKQRGNDGAVAHQFIASQQRLKLFPHSGALNTSRQGVETGNVQALPEAPSVPVPHQDVQVHGKPAITKSGYLEKLDDGRTGNGTFVDRFSARGEWLWYALRDRQLISKQTSNGVSLQGEVDVSEATAVRGTGPNEFRVITPQGSLLLRAENVIERDSWLEAFEQTDAARKELPVLSREQSEVMSLAGGIKLNPFIQNGDGGLEINELASASNLNANHSELFQHRLSCMSMDDGTELSFQSASEYHHHDATAEAARKAIFPRSSSLNPERQIKSEYRAMPLPENKRQTPRLRSISSRALANLCLLIMRRKRLAQEGSLSSVPVVRAPGEGCVFALWFLARHDIADTQNQRQQLRQQNRR